MSVRYVGPFRAVTVPLPLGGDAVVGQGESLSSTPEHEELLLGQPANWEAVVKAAAQRKTEPAAPAEEKTTTKEEETA